jgi:hypothetical protein
VLLASVYDLHGCGVDLVMSKCLYPETELGGQWPQSASLKADAA